MAQCQSPCWGYLRDQLGGPEPSAPKQMAKLDTTTRSFQASTNVELPEPTPTVNIPDSVSVDNIKAVIQHYHDTSVQPSLDLLSKHIREEVTHTLLQYLGHQTLTSLEAEQQRRSVTIYNVPPFRNMSNTTQNVNYLLSEADLNDSDVRSLTNHLHTSSTACLKVMFVNESSGKTFLQAFTAKKRYWHPSNQEDSLLKIERDFPMQERLERIPLMAIIESLTKAPPGTILNLLYDTYVKPELNSLQLWDQSSQLMLAQVVYLPDNHMQYQCHLYLNMEVLLIVLNFFANAFSLKMRSFLMFLQGYTQASRHSTTTLRYHHSQTRDVSNIGTDDAVKYFPYDIFPIELDDRLTSQLTENPSFLIQGFTGLQPLIQQAMQDNDLSYGDFGSKGRTNGDPSHSKGYGKNKGKAKPKKGSDRYHYSQTHHSYAETQDYNDPQYAPEYSREGKGSKSRQHDSHQSWRKRTEGDYPYQSRPPPKWPHKGSDDWQPPTTSQQPSQKGKGSQSDNPGTKGKVQRASEIEMAAKFFPCEECMALAGTNQDCSHCNTHYSQHYQQVVRSFKSIQKFRQPCLPSCPCPILLTDGTNCSASSSPSVFGTGNCHGCSLYRQFLWKAHMTLLHLVPTTTRSTWATRGHFLPT